MRFLGISLLAIVLAATVQAEDFTKEKIQLGKKKCLCDFSLDVGEKCKGTAKCDKKCSGSGEVEIGGCSFTLTVKRGKGKISKCSCEAAPTEPPTETTTTTGSGSGETPVPMTGSGSGETPVPITGSGSGPVPITGSGSGAPPSGGEGMQCSCKCDCPDGSGECDCDCNCPMTSKAVNCAPGFSKVCPMVGDTCPQDMEPICPKNAMGRMAGGAGDGHMADRGCQCVPDFLMDLVMIQPLAPAGRMTAVDRAMTKATIQVGKKKCKCSYEMNAKDCKKSKITCDKKCSGKASGVELEDGMYMLDIAVKKGKVTIAKCDVQAAPAPNGTGGGSGGGMGSGSGSGGGGMGGMGSRCACVSMGMGGTGPVTPTGSGSGTVPTGSGSGTVPTGSGSGPATLLPPTGSGSGSGPPPAEGPYVPGQPGGPWTEEDVEITRERIEEMLNQDNYKGFHIEYPQCGDSRVGLFVCDGSMFQFVKRDPTKGLMGNDNLSQLRRPKSSRVIQLGFHDCLKYKDGVTEGAVDGCDGCLNWKGMDFEFKETWFKGNPDNESLVNHFTRSYPISHETGNNGLAGTVKALELIYTNISWPSSARSVNVSLKESGKSRADLWAFAATVALEIEIVRANFACDIDLERQQTGILEGRDKCDIKLHRPIKFQSGRQDCIPEEGLEAPYMTNKAENHDNPWGHGDKVIANFNRDFGMSAEETIALMAAHGVQSRVHNKFLATKYAWIGTPYLSNVFFKQMAGKPVYGIDADVDGIERLNIVLSGDKEGKPVDNYGYKLTCTAMWNLTNPNGDDGPCYFKRQSNLKQNSVHRPSTMYAAIENFGPQLAIDGFVSDYGWHYFATKRQDNPWIEFQLATTKMISSITITMTTYGGSVFKNVEIRAGMEMVGEADVDSIVNINTVCDIFEGPAIKNTAYTIECTEPIEAKYLTIQIKNIDTYLQINELKINNESPLESFAKEKADDEYLRPMCFDTKRRIGNPNLDGEILRIPKDNVDENGDLISGWWTIDPPDDCCANATYVDIPDNNHYKIQQGGCKQVLSKNGDSHNFLLNFEMSMYLNFSINENNRAHGCRGLEPLTLEKHKERFNMVAEENVGCGKNMKKLFSSGGDSYSRIIEKFADDHDDWALQFLEGWDKMLRNGYTAGRLTDAPQSSWLGYNSWTKVPADTDDFEEYIVNNTPAKISNNAAEDPTIMSSEKDTYRKECEYKTGMTAWNKNFARCPKGMFDDL